MFLLIAPALGIFLVSFLPQLPSMWQTAGIALFAVGLLFYRRWLLALLCLGAIYGVLYGNQLLQRQLPQSLDGQSFWVEGLVVGLPQRGPKALRFQLQLQAIKAVNPTGDTDEVTTLVGEKIALSWYHYGVLSPPKLETGERWRLRVKLRRPRGFVNPVGFDYHLYLLQQQLMASGYVKASGDNARLAQDCPWWQADCWRQQLRQFISAQDTSHKIRYLGPLLGLLIGDRQAMTREQWQQLRKSGTIHLLAISGLHIGLAALIGFFLGSLLLRSVQLFLPRSWFYYLPSCLSIAFASVYSLLAGLSLPTQRALIMVLVVQLCVLLKRRLSPWLILSCALLLIALMDPLSLRSQGFFLSFLAVFALLFVFSGELTSTGGLSRAAFYRSGLQFIKAQWVIAIGLLLPGILLLQGLSLSSPIANLFAVPLVSLITVPLLFLALALLPFSHTGFWLVLSLADSSLHGLFSGLLWMEQWFLGFWVFDRGEVSTIALIFAALGTLFLLAPRGLSYRYLGLFFFLPLFFPHNTPVALRFTFLEVGQGTAIVVETRQHRLVYDLGRRFSERFDTGAHIVAPYLLSQGHAAIDRLVLSHGDSDHVGGFAGLQSLIDINDVFSGEAHKTSGQQCLAGQSWLWDQVSFRVVWPTAEYLVQGGEALKSNNRSCVLVITYQGHTIILAGDIEEEVERYLLTQNVLPSPTILLAPHHGSKTSSHRLWVNQLQAKNAVVTAGFTNAYCHPHPEVLARYRQAKTKIFHTGVHGALQFLFDESGGYSVKRWRQDYRQYWFD